MHDPGVMIRDTVLIVIIRVIRLGRIRQQGTPIKRRGQPRRDSAHLDIRAKDKGPGAAAEDICGRGLAKGAAAIGESELAVLDGTLDNAPLGLGVDGEGLVGILGPNLVDIGLVVPLEEVVVENDGVVWGEGAKGLAIVALYQISPRRAVSGGLGAKSVTDRLEGT